METSGSVREHVGGYVEKRIEQLSVQKEEVAKKLAQGGLAHFHDAVMGEVNKQIDTEKKRLEGNQQKLESTLDSNKILAFKGKDLPDNKRIIGMHDHQKEISAIDEQELEHAVESGDSARIEQIEHHEGIHEKYPGPDIYTQDPEILQKTLIGLYEGWTEQKNREEVKIVALDAYPEERELLKNTVDRTGNKEHLEKALRSKDTYAARIILLHSIKSTRPDLLGGYDPTLEFHQYKNSRSK